MIRKTTEQFIEQARNIHYNRYDYSKSIYVSAHQKITIICEVHGEFLQTPRNHLFGRQGKGQGCPQCMAVEKFDNLRLTNKEIDDYLITNNIPIKRIDDYVNIITNIKWQCLLCKNQWKITPNHIRRGGGCPKCKDTRLSNDDIDIFIKEHSLPLQRIDDYNNSYTKINWLCLMCNNIWKAMPCEITRMGKRGIGSGCPECARGKNEKNVGLTLKQLNINTNKLRIDLPVKQKLFPDFYLPNMNMIIEYNGIQHYEPTCFGNLSKLNAEENFIKQQRRDELLRQYCQDNEIFLLEIDGRKYKGERLKKFVLDYFSKGVSYARR